MESQNNSGKKKRTVAFTPSCVDDELHVIPSKSLPNTVDVYVGFLKVCHKYSIHFKTPHHFKSTESICCSTPSLGLAATKLLFHESHILMTVEYNCEHKEGVITESLKLSSESGGEEMMVILHMEILGKDQGTPSLREGVKCIERFLDYDSEQSDWQGF
ncbi:adipose-secreted signaling protein-like [Clavelina lepadiformis]|uniref:adipose-secreted signaling protein-like n=1 Tax=Clavelina lepadiformis TaxID=159417 RepID=UPI0040416024